MRERENIFWVFLIIFQKNFCLLECKIKVQFFCLLSASFMFFSTFFKVKLLWAYFVRKMVFLVLITLIIFLHSWGCLFNCFLTIHYEQHSGASEFLFFWGNYLFIIQVVKCELYNKGRKWYFVPSYAHYEMALVRSEIFCYFYHNMGYQKFQILLRVVISFLMLVISFFQVGYFIFSRWQVHFWR